MNQELSVLLYSEYSQNSKRILNIIKQFPNYFNQLNTLCIDNEKIRKKITKSKNIIIESVPSILCLYADGTVEKFEGSQAFSWVEEIIRMNAPPIPVQQKRPNVAPPIEEENKEPKKKKRTIEFQGSTSIDDLDSEEEEENEDYEENIVKQPARGIRTNSGNYDIIEFGESQEPNRTVQRGIKSNTEIGKSGKADILSIAQSMQKDRDKIDNLKPSGSLPDRM